MNSDFHISQVLSLVHDLTAAAQAYARERTERNRQLSVFKSSTENRLRQAKREIDEELNASFETTDAEFQAAREQAQERARATSERIEQAYTGSRHTLIRQARDREEAARVKLQQTTWAQKNAYDVKAGQAETECHRITGKLDALKDQIDDVRTEARRHFLGFGILPDAEEEDAAADPAARDADGPDARGPNATDDDLIILLEDHLVSAEGKLSRLRARALQRLFGRAATVLLVLLLVMGHGGGAWMLFRGGRLSQYGAGLGCSLVLLLVVVWLCRWLAKRQAAPAAERVTVKLAQADAAHAACLQRATARYEDALSRFAAERDAAVDAVREKTERVPQEAKAKREAGLEKAEQQRERLLRKAQERFEETTTQTQAALDERIRLLRAEADGRWAELQQDHERDKQERLRTHDEELVTLEKDCRRRLSAILDVVSGLEEVVRQTCPDWSAREWQQWQPPYDFPDLIPFGRLDAKLPELPGNVLDDLRPSSDRGKRDVALPLVLTFPHQCSLLAETTRGGRDAALDAMTNVMMRLLTLIPPGKLSFTLVDPVALGQSFAAFMHLAEKGEILSGGRIWTDPRQIEQRLADLNEHMEKVIQMYLRNDYETITEYNAQARELAERYRFLVIADFPVNFSDVALQRLASVVHSGARCGVFTLIHWDRRQPLPKEFEPTQLFKHGLHLAWRDAQFTIVGEHLSQAALAIDTPPAAALATELFRVAGDASMDASRVEVPFRSIAPAQDEYWSASAAKELTVPIGRTGAVSLQRLAFGRGTLQHALLAGKTGSGKSTLLHVLITNLSLWYSPDEIELYLIDFKKGVEFKAYATHRLPHVRALAIESDREFGLSVLERVDQELKRRGSLFRDRGVNDLAGYRALAETEPVPRTLLVIDEFQEFFTNDDRVAQNAALLLDRIVRQGRAFGIHVLLGSQTLGGAYTLARSTLGQMAVRIALQCSEADSYLILDENNAAARLLSRPGEAIYNDAAGLVEGNSPFQVSWLPDDQRDTWLQEVGRVAEQHDYQPAEPPFIFEGNAPGDVRANTTLAAALEGQRPDTPPRSATVWLGAPNAIKAPTAAQFRDQSGSHLLIVGQRDEEALAIMSAAAVSLAAQHPVQGARFVFLDGHAPDNASHEHFRHVAEALPHETQTPAYGATPELILATAAAVAERQEAPAGQQQSVYLLIYGLHRFTKLRHRDDFGFSFSADDSAAPDPSQAFGTLVADGPAAGVHIIAWCDTLSNVNRTLSRQALSEFEMRVLFQMSATDSASLIDVPTANDLGLRRALFCNQQDGTLEKFRPYALPELTWLEQVNQQLRGC